MNLPEAPEPGTEAAELETIAHAFSVCLRGTDRRALAHARARLYAAAINFAGDALFDLGDEYSDADIIAGG